MKSVTTRSNVELPHIHILNGSPETTPKNAIEVNIGSVLPAAFSGMRKLLSVLREHDPSTASMIAQSHPQEWNLLFPGSIEGASSLSDLALSPSERRLHRESEQVYRTLNVAAEMIVRTLRNGSSKLILRNTGQADLVSLRGIMRAYEWARLDSRPYEIILADWGSMASWPESVLQLRELNLDRLAKRLGSSPIGHADAYLSPIDSQSMAKGNEHICLQLAVNSKDPAERIAAAILAIRSCFYSTNYEGALLAIANALPLVENNTAGFTMQAVQRHFAELDDKNIAPAIEIDETAVESLEEVQALLWRSTGVVYSLVGNHQKAFNYFKQALDYNPSPVTSAQIHMYLGLLLSKKLSKPDEAITTLHQGLDFLKGQSSDRATLEEGWIRNVIALTYFQQRHLNKALSEEKRAATTVGKLHVPQATHLKINLISNMSVLHESAAHYTEAIQIWQRFASISSEWNTSFWKHHTYRLAGLYLEASEQEKALHEYNQAYARAKDLEDSYHSQVIAAEMGQFYLKENQKDLAHQWFSRACEHAKAIGDPFRLGESMIGEALSCGESLQPGIETAQLSTTYESKARKLLTIAEEGDQAALVNALPKLLSKLNRPFDVVNLNL
jgi:tetratricopeptide (TPR) repeat protein